MEAAASLVDAEGPDALTLAALAHRFGVAQPSLYKHVGGVEDLHGRLAVLAARDLSESVRRSVSGRSGAAALRALATAYRDYARAHPGLYGYLLRPRLGDPEHEQASREAVEVMAAVLEGYGIHGEAAVDAVRYLRSVLHGFVSLETVGGFAMSRPVEATFAVLVDGVHRSLVGWPDGSAG